VLVVGDTIDLSKGGVITAAGGIGGAGGAGASAGPGNGGNGGNGGLIELTYGSTFVFTAPLNAIASVSGGVGGLGGATGGLPGAKGTDGTILISKLTFAFGPPLIPEVTLASNAPIAELAKGSGGNPVAAGIDELEKKDKDSKQKKDAAVCK
jgi:hypothetical protein